MLARERDGEDSPSATLAAPLNEQSDEGSSMVMFLLEGLEIEELWYYLDFQP